MRFVSSQHDTQLPKLNVAGSNPATRSRPEPLAQPREAGQAEAKDTLEYSTGKEQLAEAKRGEMHSHALAPSY